MEQLELFKRVKAASKSLLQLTDNQINSVLNGVADAILENREALLEANNIDLSKMDRANPLYDRLALSNKRLEDIARDMQNVALLPSPLGRVIKKTILPNGLNLRRVSVPFGVIGVIYEARPNVSFDVFALCFKSGNASILKGGKDAENSNIAIINLIHSVLDKFGIDKNVVQLLPSTHQATAEMLSAVGYIDVCIPRGGKRLIEFVRDNAKIPVIETGAGVVNTYFDEWGDVQKGAKIICNAKTRRVSVCNALDCLIVHKKRLEDLPLLCAPLLEHNVKIYADKEAYNALKDRYSNALLFNATEESFGVEYMDYALSIKSVDSLDGAVEHIGKYGSGHSESIITESKESAERFEILVDAACVYWNAPTSFTDGAQFGLGAEIGISTQKLGARGPMGLEEITTYKWIIEGNGQVRS